MINTCPCLGVEKLVAHIESFHTIIATEDNLGVQLAGFEKSFGRLPDDLREFYRLCDGAVLFDKVEILPLSKILRASEAVLNESSDNNFPGNWLAFCVFGNGQYVGYDSETVEFSRCAFIDLDPFCDNGRFTIISYGFRHFLTNLLVSNGELFWLDPEYESVGTIGEGLT